MPRSRLDAIFQMPKTNPEITTDVAKAANALKNGCLVAFPTETVYGLGAIADVDEDVRKIYAMKDRPSDHPMIVHLADASQMGQWAKEIPEQAERLAEEFMPGPLTMVLNRKKGKGEVASGGHPTIALRVPAHELAAKLLNQVGAALVAPSANVFGRPSPTKADHVVDEFANSSLLVLDGGPTTLGIESTIVDLTDPDRPAILRFGAISPEEVEQCLGISVASGNTNRPAPGSMPSHYSPRQRLVVLGKDEYKSCVRLHDRNKVAALGFTRPAGLDDGMWVQMSNHPKVVEQRLYDDLRKLEQTDATVIVVNEVPLNPPWLAVADRLNKAANAH